ncbi:sodium/potassium-transporting ATPase subunit beta-2-like [Pectinophora gossypiella]|uniref:sodium/potassium-transporting ATPase subunit beta-2-like n=1 Tax=Pectinophora gossypiella TaxID=13191 RepID=UPI00214EEAB0|nr:sodium/potassium-transporting ATPase subunit beta-2-like [Pectinophora gossypiella]
MPECSPKEERKKMDEKGPHPPKAGQPSKPYKRVSDPPFPVPTPQLTRRDPSLPTVASTSTGQKSNPDQHTEVVKVPWTKRLRKYCYDRQNNTFCDRTCHSWLKIVSYSIIYLIFLMTYTMILLYISLMIIKNQESSPTSGLAEYLTYTPGSIGLTATPLSEFSYPLIWYRNGEADDYKKYVRALDALVSKKRQKRDVRSDLGPCGYPPYGYGAEPCIVLRINKRWHWVAEPLSPGSPQAKLAPKEVQTWVKKDAKYWLHCSGCHNYDREHIGRIKYYPDPPGFDSRQFPLRNASFAPLVAVQLSNFTLGISLAIECKLWYENGTSTVSFLLYVSPKSKGMKNGTAQFG